MPTKALEIKSKKDPIDLAAQWILKSGIQSDGGGFYAWYDLKAAAPSYLYSEITGYGITALLFLYRLLKEELFMEQAIKAGDWIIEYAMHPCGGVKTRLYNDDDKADKTYSFSGENIFSFDTGMVLYGMVNIYKQTKDKKFLDVSKRLAKFLTEKMQNIDGSLSPIYNAKTDKIIESYDKWSNQRGGFHAKVSLGLVGLFELTRDKSYSDAAVKLCEYAVATQEDSGRFITDRITKTTHLHPHCYAAEGLLYTGAVLGIPSFIESSRRATEWAYKGVTSNGINELYDPATKAFNNFQRSDIIAQLLRLGLVFSVGDKTDCLKSVLLKYQYNGEKSHQNGGLLFSRKVAHINSWCTMFAIQALAFYSHRSLISEDMQIEFFI